MGDCWPPSVGLRGQALNHPVLRWLKTVVVSDQGNGAAGPRQVGTRKTRQKRAGRGDPVRTSLLKRRKPHRWRRNRGLVWSSGLAWRIPVYWPGGARRRGGVSLVCGSCTEREKVSVDMATGVVGLQGREREHAEAATEGIEYQSWRSLADRPVVAVRSLLAGVGVERRGRLTRRVWFDQPGLRLWEEAT
jgi:hypothetical protein